MIVIKFTVEMVQEARIWLLEKGYDVSPSYIAAFYNYGGNARAVERVEKVLNSEEFLKAELLRLHDSNQLKSNISDTLELVERLREIAIKNRDAFLLRGVLVVKSWIEKEEIEAYERC